MQQLNIDTEFNGLIPPLQPEEYRQLEANILAQGCLEPIKLWKGVILDGHNRYSICQKHGIDFKTRVLDVKDRDHAKLWIGEYQLGRRNLTDDQRGMVLSDVVDIRSKIAVQARAVKAGKAGGIGRPKISLVDDSATKLSEKPKQKDKTRTVVAKENSVPERKLRHALEIKKADPKIADKVRSGEITLNEGKKLTGLAVPARQAALAAISAGADVRAAVRTAKKAEYTETIEAQAPKSLEGKYRIIYADPPWHYVGLNQCDEHGHADRHYDTLTDEQLRVFKAGGRLVSDLADSNSVLFLWVTSPMLERCFPIIKAWGFNYKSSFVWDKIKHNMGHYNSVRHELLLVCTKGSCTPDIPKLVDSVQSIERSDKHSQKPQEFVSIIEGMYDHGRKLELFARSTREGWDCDGNEVPPVAPCEAAAA